MQLLKNLLGFLILFGYNTAVSAQELTPRIDSLIEEITALTYQHQHDFAQVLIMEFINQDDLSPIEVFYGRFLFADVVKSSGNGLKAIDLLLQSKEYLNDIEERSKFESLIYGNIGECYFNLQDHANAKKYALLSVEASPSSSFRGSGHAVNNIIIGFAENLEKNHTAALEFYNNALTEYIKHGELCELPLCYIKIGRVYDEMGQHFNARKIIDKAFVLSDSCDIDQYRVLSKMSLFDHFQSNKKYKEALDVLTEINALNKEIALKKQDQELKELTAKYETELHKKENDNLKRTAKIEAASNQFLTTMLGALIAALIIILVLGIFILRLRNKKNQALSEQLEKIEAQNKERETLLKEVHHRVKNNLQVITSLLTLQSGHISDPNTIEQFKQSQYRINAMAKVHELLYQTGDLSSINIDTYLHELVTPLVNSIKGNPNNIEVDIVAPSDYLGLDTAIPLGLLINEILTNALQHGIKDHEAGKVYVHLQAKGHFEYELAIGDYGIGCPEEITFNTTPSLGLRLMKKLSRQLLGSIERVSDKPGCHYKLSFKAVG